MRKLILLAIAAWAYKKYGPQLMASGGARTPFPTSSRPPEGYGG
jgi:hypothetical protein